MAESPENQNEKLEQNEEFKDHTQTSEGPANIEVQSSPPPDVVELCRETFQKTAEYLRGELDGTIEDYKLLEKMNKITRTKYYDMTNIALSIGDALKELNSKYKGLQPYLEQIDEIEEGVASLEKAAYSLDQYSKRLEAKFKALERR